MAISSGLGDLVNGQKQGWWCRCWSNSRTSGWRATKAAELELASLTGAEILGLASDLNGRRGGAMGVVSQDGSRGRTIGAAGGLGRAEMELARETAEKQ